MDCRIFHQHLEDYLDGGLDFSGRLGVERHAQSCFMCGKQLGDAEALRQKTRTLARVCAPPDFEAAVRSKIHQKHYSHRTWWPSIAWAPTRLLAASAVILMFLGLGTLYSVQWWNLTNQTSRASSGESPAPTHALQPALQNDKEFSSSAQLSPVSAAPKMNARMNPPVHSVPPAALQADDGWLPAVDESVAPEFREYMVPGPGDRKVILRLPETIRMQYDQPSEEYFIRNVSH